MDRAAGQPEVIDGRDALWEHAELLPTADDLDDPAGFATRSTFDLSELESAGAARRTEPGEPEEPTGRALPRADPPRDVAHRRRPRAVRLGGTHA